MMESASLNEVAAHCGSRVGRMAVLTHSNLGLNLNARMSGQEILGAVGLASTSGVIEWHMMLGPTAA